MSEITGKLIVKGETQTFGANNFQKREFVIETEDKYPQQIQIELIKEKVSLLDNIQLGDTVKATYNLNGRSWTNPQGEVKYFNSVQAWKLEKVGATAAPPGQVFEPATDLKEDDYDDLPF